MNTDLLRRQFSRHLDITLDAFEILPLHSHASYRSYFRVVLPDGQSYVVMEIPAGKWSVSEEISNAELETDELPFLNMSRYLLKKGFPVAKVYSADADAGIIILEDLGDRLLEQELDNKSREEKAQLYKEAISLLVDLQNKTDPHRDDCVAFHRHFSEKLLLWELDHFFEYGIERRLHCTIKSEDRRFFEVASKKICAALLAAPQVFVHRDFQSRNLMYHKGQLYLIDFQDALIGPHSYDLVALLRDSYLVLGRELRESLLEEFLQASRRRYDTVIDREEFLQLFDWTTIQRKLKDAGRFVFIAQEKQNPSFLPYIPASLEYVREALERQTGLHEFYERLKPYVPEWK